MGNRFASGKWAISVCDRCGQGYKLRVLKKEVIKGRNYDLLVCPTCWDPDHPQLHLGEQPVYDPQGLRNPRPDRSYVTSGLDANGYPSGGSRDIQWGWNPVGGGRAFDDALTPNYLVLAVEIGTVTISV